MNIRIPDRFLLMLSSLMLVSLACFGNSNVQGSGPQANDAVIPVTGGTDVAEAVVAPISLKLPDQRANQAGDEDSSPNATKKRVSGGEKYVKGLLERPFNAETMDTYFPYLDIVDTKGFVDETWGYASITMAGTDGNGQLPGKYGVELDLDRDGRGEWLILVAKPVSTDWTIEGVQVWNDADKDVGGAAPTVAEEIPAGNGYESLVFDQSKGGGADGAWAHVSTEDPKTIFLAFKLSMMSTPKSFVMGAWAGADSLDPALFDFNDHMTHMEAGSPLPDLFVYPLKKLAEIDNTCRMAIGFVPTGNEPGLCATILHDSHDVATPASCSPIAGVPCTP